MCAKEHVLAFRLQTNRMEQTIPFAKASIPNRNPFFIGRPR